MKIGNIQELPWYLRLAIFSAVALVVYGGFWYFVTSGTRAETKNLEVQIEDLRAKNAQAQISQQRLNESRAAYKSRQEEYEELKALLPEQRELTSVLQGVTDRASSSRLKVTRFSPKEDVQQDFYSGKPVEVAVPAHSQTCVPSLTRWPAISASSRLPISRSACALTKRTKVPEKRLTRSF